jgi:hypothetical protein
MGEHGPTRPYGEAGQGENNFNAHGRTQVMKRQMQFGLLFAGLAVHSVRAECPPIDFENLAVGTAVTTQYDGVTFSVVPQSCNNSPTLYMRIVSGVPGGTSSGAKALQIDTGCPDFSPDYLRMRFDDLQREVTFMLGEATGGADYDFDVRYYSDAGLLGTLHVVSGSGVNRFVRVGSSTHAQNIRRVEVQSTIGAFEAIDDLLVGGDTTPPQAQIDSPAFEACSCGTVTVRGIACDPDGAYAGDTLEYRGVDAPAGSAWTLIGSATTEVCTSGLLYLWNTTALAHGHYYLRLTVTNACGLSNTAVTVAYVDRLFNTAVMRYPAEGGVIGGRVCIDGTAWDDWCFDSYRVEYQPAAGGAWTPVDAAHPLYDLAVINDPMASWDTKGLALPDGDYRLRLTATDTCGNTGNVTRVVRVDNAAPVAQITAPAMCAVVDGTVTVRGTITDSNAAQWRLQMSGGDDSAWVTLATGNAPIINGTLAQWDTSDLPSCAYALRLEVEDAAQIDCNTGSHNRAETVTTIYVRPCLGDIDGDADVDISDLTLLLSRFGLMCP